MAVTTSVYVPVDGAKSAVSVRVEDALPPAGTVTGLGRFIVTPSGAAPVHAADRLMEELNPFTDANTIVVDLDTLGVKVSTPGDGWVRKSGLGAETTVPRGVTINWRPAECDRPLGLMPVKVNGYVPGSNVSST